MGCTCKQTGQCGYCQMKDERPRPMSLRDYDGELTLKCCPFCSGEAERVVADAWNSRPVAAPDARVTVREALSGALVISRTGSMSARRVHDVKRFMEVEKRIREALALLAKDGE